MNARNLLLALSLMTVPATAAADASGSFYGTTEQITVGSGKTLQVGSIQRQDGPFVFYSLAAFDGKHVALTPIWGEYEFMMGVYQGGFDKVLVFASGHDPADYDPNVHPSEQPGYVAVIRLNSDGSPDRTFNKTGRVILGASEVAGVNVYPGGDVALLDWHDNEIGSIGSDGTLFTGMADPQRGPRVIAFESLIEYRNARDQYFIAGDPAEFSWLDSGQSPGWSRTSHAFHAYPAGSTQGAPVCRFYGGPDPARRNHFFTADPGECNVVANDPKHTFFLETREAFRLDFPASGACPESQKPIFRLLSPHGDAAHRFTTSETVARQMVASGWRAEGQPDGKGNVVALCAAP